MIFTRFLFLRLLSCVRDSVVNKIVSNSDLGLPTEFICRPTTFFRDGVGLASLCDERAVQSQPANRSK